jgi:hypothetical protein
LQTERQLHRVSELKERLQTQLKEGANAVRHEVTSINNQPTSNLIKHFLLLKQEEEVEAVGLSPNHIEKTSDKEYLWETLMFLHNSLIETAENLTDEEKKELDNYISIKNLSNTAIALKSQFEQAKKEKRELTDLLVSIKKPLLKNLFHQPTWVYASIIIILLMMVSISRWAGLSTVVPIGIAWRLKVQKKSSYCSEIESRISQLDKDHESLKRLLSEVEKEIQQRLSVFTLYPELKTILG